MEEKVLHLSSLIDRFISDPYLVSNEECSTARSIMIELKDMFVNKGLQKCHSRMAVSPERVDSLYRGESGRRIHLERESVNSLFEVLRPFVETNWSESSHGRESYIESKLTVMLPKRRRYGL